MAPTPAAALVHTGGVVAVIGRVLLGVCHNDGVNAEGRPESAAEAALGLTGGKQADAIKLSTRSKGCFRNGVQAAVAARSSSNIVQVQTVTAFVQMSLFMLLS